MKGVPRAATNNMSEEMKNSVEEEEIEVYTLTDEDGKEEEFELLAETVIDGVRYLALAPFSEEAVEALEYVILKEDEENGEKFFSTVDDDETFERVSEFFDDLFFNEIDLDN